MCDTTIPLMVINTSDIYRSYLNALLEYKIITDNPCFKTYLKPFPDETLKKHLNGHLMSLIEYYDPPLLCFCEYTVKGAGKSSSRTKDC